MLPFFFAKLEASLHLLLILSNANAMTASKSAYCVRNILNSIVPNEHRSSQSIRPIRAHLLRAGKLFQKASFEEQVVYLVNNVQGLEPEQARFILKSIFEHPQARKDVRVVFGGSRVRGNATATSDLDVGVYGFANNPLTKLIKKVNDKVAQGEFKIPLETTKIYENNFTSSIPLILSPEEFFLRTGKVAHTVGDLKEFHPSGFISVGADGTIVHLPPPERR